MKQNQFSKMIACALLMSACTVPNPNRHKDAGTDAKPTGCQSSAECSGATAVCDTTAGSCVQCTVAESGACSGATPYCGTDNTCKACTMHNQCASDVCLPDGCSAENNVAYVASNGKGAACTKDLPCSSLQIALDTRRPVVKMTGTIADNVTITNQTVTIAADPGAQLTRSTTGKLITIAGNSKVTIYDLELTGAQSSPASTGCALWMKNGGAPEVTLQRVTMSSNDWCPASNESAGTLTVLQSTAHDNGAGIVAVYGGALNIIESTIYNTRMSHAIGSTGPLYVTRSTIRDNRSGAIFMGTSPISFTISNNFIVRNGSASDPTLLGGIIVYADNSGTNKIEFNTIADNTSTNSDTTNNSVLGGGISCVKGTGSFTANNNIIVRNRNAAVPSATADCNAGNSFVGPGDPGFVSPTDYHLSLRTPADIVDKASCPGNTVDVDGEQRPIGAGCDLGADELAK